jgi:acetolactate synthase regulatory subunit
MKSALELRLNNIEGVIERVLGTLRQRGFELCSMQMERSNDAATLKVSVTVDSHRPIEGACRQLAKLFDVQSVILQYSEAMAAEGYAQHEKSNQREVLLSV